MNRIAIFVSYLIVACIIPHYLIAQTLPPPHCDDCYEDGVPVTWEGTYTSSVLDYTGSGICGSPPQQWYVKYKTRICKGQLHFKIVALVNYGNTNCDWTSSHIAICAAAENLLSQSSILNALQSYSILITPGTSMQIRVFAGSCWYYPEHLYAPNEQPCYDTELEVLVPCGRACCVFPAEIQFSPCANDNLLITRYDPYTIGDGPCDDETIDPDICYPSLLNSATRPATCQPACYNCKIRP